MIDRRPTVSFSEKGECPCPDLSCTLYGTIRPGKHIRGCKCRSCLGRRNRRSGLKKQREARKALGVAPSHKFGDANEENWHDPLWANEVKSGKQCGPVQNAWLRAEKQILSNRADHGDRRKQARVVWMPEGWSDGLVCVRLSSWNELVRPALEEFYGEVA